mmetsp:Transcript_9549/g.30257  ORF Transcript_9549/g.30257 Transcript_9549/m.30257 type:complete len:283 (-) Transcript_9549:36-884(-)
MSANSAEQSIFPVLHHVPVSNTTVYYPMEDSFCLADTLHAHQHNLLPCHRQPQPVDSLSPPDGSPGTCTALPAGPWVEVGPGSGYIGASLLAAHARRGVQLYLGFDVNREAAATTRLTVEATLDRERKESSDVAAPLFDTVQADLVTSLRSSSVPLLFCNPPYIPSEPYNGDPAGTAGTGVGAGRPGMDDVDLGWAGGEEGTEMINALLLEAERVLVPGGLLYLLTERANNPTAVMARCNQVESWTCTKVHEKRARNEYYVILQVRKAGGGATCATCKRPIA